MRVFLFLLDRLRITELQIIELISDELQSTKGDHRAWDNANVVVNETYMICSNGYMHEEPYPAHLLSMVFTFDSTFHA